MEGRFYCPTWYHDNRFTRWAERVIHRVAEHTICRVRGHRPCRYIYGPCARCYVWYRPDPGELRRMWVERGNVAVGFSVTLLLLGFLAMLWSRADVQAAFHTITTRL